MNVRCLRSAIIAIALIATTVANAQVTGLSTNGHDIIVHVDPALHQRFGLAYPVTYILPLGADEPGLHAWVRYDSVSAWTALTEKQAGDFFNGIDAVRFDHAADIAYVSATLSAGSDDLHIRITTAAGTPVAVSYGGVAHYYDNRTAAVLVSIDDWKQYTDTTFARMIPILRSYHLPFTAGVITGDWSDSTYAHIQAQLNAGGMEVAAHERDHERWPYEDVDYQVAGSRLDILDHLTMPEQYRRGSTQYLYTFIVPYGETSPQIEAAVTRAGYLNDRIVGEQNGLFSAWDTSQGRFHYDGTTREMGSPWGSIDASSLNASFDQRLANGMIYHLLMHPHSLVTSGEIYQQFFADHLGHISNRTNVWYTTFGHLYVYRLLGDTTVGQTVWPETAPVVTVDPISQIVVDSTGVAFSCAATGTLPLTYRWQRNGVDIPGATISTLTIAMVTRADSGNSYRCIVTNARGSDTSAAALLTVIPSSSGSGIVSDDFNATALNTILWQVVNPLHDASFATTGGGTNDAELAITVPAGAGHDLWNTGNTAPRILQPCANADLSIEAKFDATMASSIEVQGLIVAQDSLNFVRFDLIYDEGILTVFAATFTDGVPTEQATVEVALHAPYYLRLRRTGNNWTGYYSANGIAWTTGAAFAHVLTARQVGVWIGNAGASAPRFTGLVDYFFNTSSPVIGEDGPDVRVPPSITVEPQGATRYAGQAASFTVTATGTAPLAYRWQKNGGDVPGATGSSLALATVARSDSGAVFRCIVSNMVGTDTSAAAVLRVLRLDTAKIVRGPADTTVMVGTPAHFSVTASGTQPLTFQWLRNGSLIPEAADSAFVVGPAAQSDSGAAFRCIVTNIGGSDTSAAALLRVTPLPAPPMGVRIDLHILLQGAISGDTMRTDLREAGLLPLDHPFAGLGWITSGLDSVGAIPPGIVDWVLVEIRTDSSDSTIKARQAAFLRKDGTVTGLDGTGPVCFATLSPGSYVVVVRHRNHLPIMSATALTLDTTAVTYDFRTSLAKYCGGDAAMLGEGKFGMVAGDADQNHGIGATDLARVRQALAPGSLYRDADVDLSGTVTSADISVTRINIGRVTKVH